MNNETAESTAALLSALRRRGASTECETLLLRDLDRQTSFALDYRVVVPAGQLTDIYTVRRNSEALRREQTGAVLWCDLDRLVDTLSAVQREHQITMISMESSERIYRLFCSSQEILSVICSGR